MSKKTVVIAGRMNVGKSTLFNRLACHKQSIALDYAGVTRDFIKDSVSWDGVVFDLIDTGGMSLRKSTDPLLEKVRAIAQQQVELADIVLLMVDGAIGLLPEDKEIARALRKTEKSVFLIINKADARVAQEHKHEFERLGFEQLFFISAQHGTGIAELLEALVLRLKNKSDSAQSSSDQVATYKVALIGKPNVGKSSLMNLLAKQERSLVLDMPGTTREAISAEIQFYNQKIELLDTPGVRRKRAVEGDLEPLMVKSSFNALKQANIIILVIDAAEAAFVDQELKLACYAFQQEYKAVVMLINKQDLATPESERLLTHSMSFYKYFFDKIPVITISCLTGKNIGSLVPLLDKLWKKYTSLFDAELIYKLFQQRLTKTPLFVQRQRLILYKVEQLKTAPITFLLVVNDTKLFAKSHEAFFEHILRDTYDLKGVPVKFIVRSRD